MIKRVESKSQCLPLDSTKEGSSFKAEVDLHRKRTLTIREPCSVTEIAAEAAAGLTGGFGKRKNLTDHFFVFELGLTSAATHERHDAQTLAIPNKADISSSAEATVGLTGGSGKEKNLTDHFSVFQLGLTFGAPYERHYPQTLAILNKESCSRDY
ncbi:uncharacterized protein [Nicotiana sylvestris]|uniref:uncharacterized protein isoform X2 n=1 Tax=Nicotiana sylvestris TaxID=4096 RepID=UPI00388C47DB